MLRFIKTLSKANKGVVFVIADLSGGGSQRVAVTIANALVRQGVKVDFVLTRSEPKSTFLLAQGIEVYSLRKTSQLWPKGGLVENLRLLFAIRLFITKLKPRSVVSFIAPTNVLTTLALVGCRANLIISERNDPAIQSFGRGWDFLRKTVYKWAYKVTANSLGARQSLKSFVPANKIFLLPNPLSLNPSDGSDRPRQKTLLAVGRLNRQKGFDLLFHAFADLKRENSAIGWRIKVAGVGELKEELQSLAEILNIADDIEWLGFKSNLTEEYSTAGIFVLPSRHEGMPNALMEALAFGMPAVVSDASPGIIECIDGGRLALTFATGDAHFLAGELKKLMNDPVLQKNLGTRAARYYDRLSENEIVTRWREILEI